jgi:class 3 adenylate cyclase
MCLSWCNCALQSKRSKGCPRASKPGDKVLVSILVTDVKDFSDLTRRYPELMNKAMGGHNNIMRKACHTHAGHVLDQEVRCCSGVWLAGADTW